MRNSLVRSPLVRTLVALTLVFLPLQPNYGGDVDSGCAAGQRAHHVSVPGQASVEHRHAARERQAHRPAADAHAALAASHDDRSCVGPLCDGNCLTCATGAVLATPLALVDVGGSDAIHARAPAYIQVVLPLPTHPPQNDRR
jgi:hypothetical protein